MVPKKETADRNVSEPRPPGGRKRKRSTGDSAPHRPPLDPALEDELYRRMLEVEDSRILASPRAAEYVSLFDDLLSLAHTTTPHPEAQEPLEALFTLLLRERAGGLTRRILGAAKYALEEITLGPPHRRPPHYALTLCLARRFKQVLEVRTEAASRHGSPTESDSQGDAIRYAHAYDGILFSERARILAGPEGELYARLERDFLLQGNVDTPAGAEAEGDAQAQAVAIAISNDAPLIGFLYDERRFDFLLRAERLRNEAEQTEPFTEFLQHDGAPPAVVDRARAADNFHRALAERDTEPASNPPTKEVHMDKKEPEPSPLPTATEGRISMTLRLPASEYRLAKSFADGLGLTMTAYINEAVAKRNARVAQDPELQQEIEARRAYEARYPKDRRPRRQTRRTRGPS